jgi:hypothetical protein
MVRRARGIKLSDAVAIDRLHHADPAKVIGAVVLSGLGDATALLGIVVQGLVVSQALSGFYETARRKIQSPSVKCQKAIEDDKEPIGKLEIFLGAPFLLSLGIFRFGNRCGDSFVIRAIPVFGFGCLGLTVMLVVLQGHAG